MIYVIDTNSIIKLHGFFPSVFPSLWKRINNLIAAEKRLISVSEVLKEIDDKTGTLKDWAKNNEEMFARPTPDEAQFVTEIFKANKHWRTLQVLWTITHVKDSPWEITWNR